MPATTRGSRWAVFRGFESRRSRFYCLCERIASSVFAACCSPSKVGTGLAALQRTHDLYIQEVQDLRRAVDLLQSLPYVDGKRLGFVGFSGGARMGAILAGHEPRIRASDLIGGGGLSTKAFVDAAPARRPRRHRARLREPRRPR